MQVICTDGTTFSCEGYELTKYGVKLLAEDRDDDDDRYDSKPPAVGYVPHDRLWYIVPDGVRPENAGRTTPAVHPANRTEPRSDQATGRRPPPASPSRMDR